MLRLVIGLLALAAAAALAIVLTPATAIRAWAVQVTPDGDPRFLTPSFLASVKLGCGLAAAGALAIAVLLATWWRRTAQRGIQWVLCDAAAFLRPAVHGFLADVRNETAYHRLALAGILAVAVVVRLFYLSQSMRHDEARTFLSFASHPPIDFLSNYWAPNNHVFHTLLVHISWMLFGDHPAVLRLPAFLAGCLMVPAAYACARRLFGSNAAIVTAGLLAVWPAAIEYSVNARGYTLVTLCMLAVLYLATYLRERVSFAGWALFVVSGVLGLYTVPIMLYGLGTTGIWLMISSARERRWRVTVELAAAAAAVIVLTIGIYIPVLFRSGAAAVVANPTTRPASLDTLTSRAPSFFRTIWEWWTMDIPPVLMLMLCAGLAASLLPIKGAGQRTTAVLASMLLFIVPFGLIHGQVPPPRVAFILLPLLIAVMAAGFAALTAALLRAPLAAKLCATGGVAIAMFLGGYQLSTRQEVGLTRDAYSDVEKAVALLKPELRPGDLAVARFPASGPLEFYLRRAGIGKRLFHKFDHNWEDTVIVDAQRVFVVVQPERYRLDDFEVENLDWKSYFLPPRVLADFGASQVVVFEKPAQAVQTVPAVMAR